MKSKPRKLQVLQAGKRVEDVRFVEKVVVKSGAQLSIFPSLITSRYFAIPLAREVLARGFKHSGDLVFLKTPVTWGEIYRVFVEAARLRSPEAATATALGQNNPPDSIANRKFSFLSITSKMGCYSFNLLAGPDMGSCPAAAFGFMFTPEAEQLKARKAMANPRPIDELNFICSACYALKGQYGTPNVAFSQTLRHEYAQMLLREGSFVDRMVQSIQHRSKLQRAARSKAQAHLRWAVPHPDYFRIHDAGDLDTPQYTEAWFEVCRQLPHIHFWAPTRMLEMRKGSSTVIAKGIPHNLALRPSALHLGEAAPPVQNPSTAAATLYGTVYPGLSAGSGALPDTSKAPGWSCPATLHWSVGGGKPLEPKERSELPREQRSYSCGLAHGPHSPFFGGKSSDETPQGAGCRVCWRHKELPIYYTEH